MRREAWKGIDYTPSIEQAAAHDSPARFKIVVGGERGGKSRSAGAEVGARYFADLLYYNQSILYWLVGPDYEQARAEFIYCVEWATKLGLVLPGGISMPQQGPCRLKLLGGEIVTKSANDPERLGSVAPHGIVMCEAAQHSYESFLRLRGRLAEKRGWLWACGTFEGSLGWYPEKWMEWQHENLDGGQSFSIPTWSNLAIFPGGRYDPEILALEQSYPADRFMERFGAIPTPPTGRVLKEVKESLHIFDWQFDEHLPVYLWIDPGYHPSAYAVEVFQIERATDIVRGLDEVYVQGLTTDEVIYKCSKYPWWKQFIENGGGAIDVAAKQHQAMAAPIEIWEKETGVRLAAARVDTEDGLDRLRTFLRPDPFTGLPKITFSPKQRGFIAEAGLGKNPYPEIGVWRYKTDSHGNVVSDKPEDKNNHAAKATIYGLVNKFGYTKRLARKTLNPYTGVTNARTR